MINNKLLAIILTIMLAAAPSINACATCMGNTDHPMIKGAAYAVLFLLAVVLSVIAGIGVFFWNIYRRSKLHAITVQEQQYVPTSGNGS